MDTTTSIEPVVSYYTVDMSSNNNFIQTQVVQGDGNDTRRIILELVSNNVPYELNPDEVFVTIAGTKPDGKEIWNECEVVDGKIVVHITYQMTTTVGRSNYQIVIMDRAFNKQIKSFPFFLIVVAAAFDPTYIMSQNEFQALAESITASEAAAREAEASAREAEEYAEQASMSGTIGMMHIASSVNPVSGEKIGHLYFDKAKDWKGNFHITREAGHLVVVWE